MRPTRSRAIGVAATVPPFAIRPVRSSRAMVLRMVMMVTPVRSAATTTAARGSAAAPRAQTGAIKRASASRLGA